MIGSVPACFAWEPAAYWLTSRGRWVRSKHAVDVTRLVLHEVLTDVSGQIYHQVTGQYAAYHDLPMA